MTNDGRIAGRLAGIWALLGVSVLLGFAILRLGARGLTLPFGDLTLVEWAALLASIVTFVYGEGVLALQRSWVPRVVERARALRREKRRVFRVLAPLYAMSMVGASPRRMVGGWALFLGVVTLAIVVQRLPNPWRGIVDLGVAGALAWGLFFLVVSTVRGRDSVGTRPKAEPT